MSISGIIIRKVYFPLMEIIKSNKIRTNLNYLQKTEKSALRELEKLQEEKLKKLLIHCLTEVPAYKKYENLLPTVEENPIKALEKLPALTKKSFSENSDLYFPEGQSADDLIPNRTGGSKFFMDRKTVEFYEAARWRGLSWWGIRIGDPCIMIWGSPIELTQQQNKSYELKEKFLKNRVIIPAYNLNEKDISKYLDLIKKFKPAYFYGYASALYLFSKILSENGIILKGNYKGVVSTAETLHDFQREKIEQVFGCKVINEYGARDGGIIAYQCPQGNMHITMENAIVEILDIRTLEPVKSGQCGLVAITDLNNYVMPRLRYLVGDTAVLGETCECGRGLLIFTEITGREDDIFLSLKGNYIHGHFFNHIVRNLDGIKQFQIIQKDRGNLLLKLIKSHNFRTEEAESFIAKIIEAMGSVNIDVEFVDEIPPMASGKVRYAVREFPLN